MLLFPGFEIFSSQTIIWIRLANLSDVHNHKGRYEIFQLDLVNRRLSSLKVIRCIQVCSQVLRHGESARVNPIGFQRGQDFEMKRRVPLPWPIGVRLIQGISQIHNLDLPFGNLI